MNAKFRPLLLVTLISAATAAMAEDTDVVELDTYTNEADIEDNIGLMQTDPVDSVFGFSKDIVETPRSVSSVGAEFMQEYNITSINDIATFVPGAFTTSFFGVAGSLDLRGTPGDNYFRGVKRINNDGVYPTAIGATDRIDIIRGPMSPISGPSRVGGALNFVPKSSRAETGAYLDSPTGEVAITYGSYGQKVMSGEVGGPATIAGKEAGYYIYAELENSDSFYQNNFNKQDLLQGSFNMELTEKSRIEFGGMYQNWDGKENAGWNRVTQDLIDDGTYITGDAAYTPPDFNNDGIINDNEVVAGFGSLPSGFGANTACFSGSPQLFCIDYAAAALDPSNLEAAAIPAEYGLDPSTVGTTKLDPKQVLISKRDKYETEVSTFYFDYILDTDSGWEIKNKFFYEKLRSANIDSYGFAKTGSTEAYENQLIFSNAFAGDIYSTELQISPSIRYVDAYYANDFVHETFDRVDITKGYNSTNTFASPLDSSDPWGIDDSSQYTQYGLAFLADTTLYQNLGILLGLRYDYVDIDAQTGDEVTFFSRTAGAKTSDTDDALSYNLSLSYKTPIGLIPYFTYAKQSTILAGTHDAVEVNTVNAGDWLGESIMREIGVKGKFLDDRIYFAAAAYNQERVAVNSNVGESNEALETKGYEMELRFLATEKLSLTATMSHMNVYRTGLDGVMFTYIGAADVPQLDPASLYGGIAGGNFAVSDKVERGGVPENVYNASARYQFNKEWAGLVSLTHVDSVTPSPLASLTLPSYNLVNLSVNYDTDNYRLDLNISNLLDEQYFRANFPGLYGNNTVLPELPRTVSGTFTYKF